jgi:CheY-like chemotaxis protein
MEAVGQLTGGVAHDFNNLLTIILGNAELLLDGSRTPALTRSAAETIFKAAERGADLIEKLLAFGRRQSLKPERLDIDEVVRSIEPLLRRALGAQIDIALELLGSSMRAVTDRISLENALLNLVLNAREAMPQRGTLTITTGQRTAKAGEGVLPIGQPVVFVTVTDTGCGMSPEVLQRAFEPFFTTKELGKGTGLGLSMVYGFAQQSGGHVCIKSKVGVGTTVTIVLPAVTSSPVQIGSGQAEPPDGVRGQGRILVVEDEAEVRALVSAQLVDLGYDVVAVPTGQDALIQLEADSSFDLLFTDVVLPHGMSGLELSRLARQRSPQLQILLTSGYAEEIFERYGRPQENLPLLRKPYGRKELSATLTSVLPPAAAHRRQPADAGLERREQASAAV